MSEQARRALRAIVPSSHVSSYGYFQKALLESHTQPNPFTHYDERDANMSLGSYLS